MNYNVFLGNSLVVQWLGLHAFTVKGPGSFPGRGTKISQVAWCSQETNKKSQIFFLVQFLKSYVQFLYS